MAKTTIGGQFNADTFRTAIKATMQMGAPNSVPERATFRWTTVRTFATTDNRGKPWKKDQAPLTTVAHVDVQVDCAVEFIPRTTLSGGTSTGEFDTPRAVITVLDVDYELLDGADKVLLGQNTYNVDYIAPPVGLFDVTVWSIHCSAVDEV